METKTIQNKKIKTLTTRLARYEADVEKAQAEPDRENHKNILAFYQIQVHRVKYEIEEAVISEKKRLVRRNIKKIIKAEAELKALRAETNSLLQVKGYGFDYMAMSDLKEELDKTYDHWELSDILYGEK